MAFCLNIDWFEVFTYEPTWCTGPEWYESLGYTVVVRDYGTRVYSQMFTLFDKHGQPWLEVRRSPLSKKSAGGILDDRACSMRLVNRACYQALCIPELWQFLRDHGFRYKDNVCALSRIDLCCDFTRLPVGDGEVSPADFIHDYMAGIYYKVNQPRVRAYATEREDGMHYHQVSWGSPSSSVSAKLYNKSLELAEQKMKPYIVDAWLKSGVLKDDLDDTAVWRLEYCLRAGTDNWISDKDEDFYLSNTIDAWLNTGNYIKFFNGLIRHYFQFAIADGDTPKYKCKRVVPFPKLSTDAYRPVKEVTSCRDSGRSEKMVINKLERLRDSGAVDKRYQGAINSVLFLFYDVYYMRRFKRLSNDDDVVRSLENLIENYNSELIGDLFGRLQDGCKSMEELASMDVVYAMYQRDLNGLASTLLKKPPYSITAVEFSRHDEGATSRQLIIRNLEKKLEWLENGLPSTADLQRQVEKIDETRERLENMLDLDWNMKKVAEGHT